MSKWRFEPEDFLASKKAKMLLSEQDRALAEAMADFAAERANELFQEWLREAPTSTCDVDPRLPLDEQAKQLEEPFDGREWEFKMVDIKPVEKKG